MSCSQADRLRTEAAFRHLSWRGCLGWAAAGALVLLALGIAVSLYESVASARTVQRYPPPGELVDVGGYRLHVHCIGERNDPGYTVILESGSPGYSLDGSLVQPGVAESTRVCVYDRAGYGWSEPGPEPRSAGQMVSELHALLENSGEAGPYVLVGAGSGGLVTQMYAAQHPEKVVGLVLVDSLYGDWLARMPEELVNAEARRLPALAGRRLMAQLGVLRVASTLRLMDRRRLAETRTLPPGIREMAQALEYRAQHSDVAYKERAAQDESLAQARAAGPVPEVPLAVLTHGIPHDWQPPGVPQAAVEQAERAWRDRQAEMANSVLDSTLIVAEHSGHAIPMEQPEAVVEAIDWAIAATRRSAC